MRFISVCWTRVTAGARALVRPSRELHSHDLHRPAAGVGGMLMTSAFAGGLIHFNRQL